MSKPSLPPLTFHDGERPETAPARRHTPPPREPEPALEPAPAPEPPPPSPTPAAEELLAEVRVGEVRVVIYRRNP